MRSSPNFDVLKEPKGFIKLLQIFIAIFAFAACTGYRGEGEFTQTCTKSGTAESKTLEFKFDYPFGSGKPTITFPACNTADTTQYTFDLGYTGSTQYFVCIGVVCFLYCLGMLVYYVLFEEDVPSTDSKFSPPVIDFVVSGALAFFWFTSAIAMAASVTGIRNSTDLAEIFTKITACNGLGSCKIVSHPKYATLDIAAVLGFLNVFVWCGNMWFLFKETPWHRPHGGPATVSGQPAQVSRPAAAI